MENLPIDILLFIIPFLVDYDKDYIMLVSLAITSKTMRRYYKEQLKYLPRRSRRKREKRILPNIQYPNKKRKRLSIRSELLLDIKCNPTLTDSQIKKILELKRQFLAYMSPYIENDIRVIYNPIYNSKNIKKKTSLRKAYELSSEVKRMVMNGDIIGLKSDIAMRRLKEAINYDFSPNTFNYALRLCDPPLIRRQSTDKYYVVDYWWNCSIKYQYITTAITYLLKLNDKLIIGQSINNVKVTLMLLFGKTFNGNFLKSLKNVTFNQKKLYSRTNGRNNSNTIEWKEN